MKQELHAHHKRLESRKSHKKEQNKYIYRNVTQKKVNTYMVKQKNYPHHSTDPEAEMDGIDADDSLVGVLHDSIEKAQVVCRHCKKA